MVLKLMKLLLGYAYVIQPSIILMMGSYSVIFKVHKDEDGFLCASGIEHAIFTDGKDREELMKNIREAVECHFDVPSDQVDIKITYIEDDMYDRGQT